MKTPLRLPPFPLRVAPTLLLLASLVFVAALPVQAVNYGSLSSSRMPPAGFPDVTWSDPGGWTTIDVTTAGLAANDPYTDASAAVLNILSTTSGRRILFFPTGTYYFRTSLRIETGDVRLKGNGRSNTTFIIDVPSGQTGSLGFGGALSGSTLPVSGSLAAGATTVTVSSAATINAGDFIRLYATNWVVETTNNVVGQIFRVDAKSGNVLTLDMPLGIAIDATKSPVVQKLSMVANVGIEDLRIHRLHDNLDYSNNAFFSYVYNGRMINLESSYSANTHLVANYSKRIVMEGNDVHDGYNYGGGGHGYGIVFQSSTTQARASHNKVWNLRHHLLLASSANHCVMSYNSVEANSSGSPNSIVCHGLYAHNNLFEGNRSAGSVLVDGAHGLDGPRNTFFRDYSSASLGAVNDGATETNMIGNIMGFLTNSTSDNNYVGANRQSGTILWGVLSSSSTIPVSLYADTKPGFLGAKPWPIYGPGVDASWGTGNTLPAADRARPGVIPVSFRATDDAFVRNGTYAGTPQGGTTATVVEVKNDGTSFAREGFFKFAFTSYGGSVSNAVISLVPTHTGQAGIVHQVTLVSSNTWTEGAITWNNKPASSTLLGTYTITEGVPVNIPVTSQVQAAMTSGKLLSIRIVSTTPPVGTGIVFYASSEDPSAVLRPVLNITP